MDRREFLGGSAGAIAGLASGGMATRVTLVLDPADSVVASPPSAHGARTLRDHLSARGVAVEINDRVEIPREGACVVAAGAGSRIARDYLTKSGASLPASPESLALIEGLAGQRLFTLACGRDAHGLMYALLELADRVEHGADPVAALRVPKLIVERPANEVRSVMRCFSSDVEDKPWFHGRGYWRQYLDMLASHRFNRLHLALGIGYDFLNEVTDSYLHFPYPFLLEVPGYRVTARGLPDGERDLNLEMLKFASEEAANRGIQFTLGLWTHGYDWSKNRGVNYYIDGLTPENHAGYCREAVRTLLAACPCVGGVTFRTHGESGIPEATYPFWKQVFEGVKGCGRAVEIDLHAKGLDQEMIDLALATSNRVTVAPKFWAEHMGLPYHQAAIRQLEMPPQGKQDSGFFAKSDGSRRFLRYGYGDLLTEGRKYGVVYRMWPGTQRFLLWGDAAMAAAYGRASSFCGSQGMDLFEPLSFKGRKGSGLPGGRLGYADKSLEPGLDFEKYAYTYRLWGRHLYNPDCSPDVWRRYLRHELGAAAGHAEEALASASRILPLITTAHLPSAANNGYWPEMYTNIPIVDANRPHPYGDTPSPKRFGTVSPIDPELFSTIEQYAAELATGRTGWRYSPRWVADRLGRLAARAEEHAVQLSAAAHGGDDAFTRRLLADIDIQVCTARFFALKLQAGIQYALFERTGNPEALKHALAGYREARKQWARMSDAARAYRSDVTYGRAAHLRGNWADRLAAIDADITDMEAKLAGASGPSKPLPPMDLFDHGEELLHRAPERVRRGQAVNLRVESRLQPAERSFSLTLRYRRVNQAESWQPAEMIRRAGGFEGAIPAAYTDSPFPLQYYFVLRGGLGAWPWPGLGDDLCNQPYFVTRQG